MTETNKRRVKKIAGELIVPAMMLFCVGIYWSDAAGLSAEAMALPLALTSVIVLAGLAVVATTFISAVKTGQNEFGAVEDDGIDVMLPVKTWLIVSMPVPLVYFWRELGAIPVFLLYAAGILLLLGERRRLWLVLVPSFLAVGLVYLFKTILYVRLPDIP